MNNRRYLFNTITVSGGEPFDQKKKKINALLSILDMSFPEKKIVLYTRYSENYVKTFHHKALTFLDNVWCENCDPDTRYEIEGRRVF